MFNKRQEVTFLMIQRDHLLTAPGTLGTLMVIITSMVGMILPDHAADYRRTSGETDRCMIVSYR
jgi:hypothetical protein